MSAAVGEEIITRIVGYALTPGNFALTSPNLPIRVEITGQPNTDMEDDVEENIAQQISSVADAAELAGWGSPIYQAAKILFPSIGGIPVFVRLQKAAVGSAAKEIKIEVTGTATKNGTHYLVIAGRKTVGGQTYNINILKDDTSADIHGKIKDKITEVLGCPMSAVSDDYSTDLTSKWKGKDADKITVSIDLNGDALGLEYAVSETASASGTPDIAAALAEIGNTWTTHLINGYGPVTTTMDALESFNGKPSATNPTGRYQGTTFKPLLAYTGDVSEDPSDVYDTRKTELTIVPAVAPLSPGLEIEAAANWCLLDALKSQNTPHLDIAGQALPDMPAPESIGVMADAMERQKIVLKGCGTVDLIDGVYVIQDPVTTYHPIGEIPPQWRYTRDIIIDWNVRYTYFTKEQKFVVDHVIAKDSEKISASKIVKPKTWKGVLADMGTELSSRALITDVDFMVASLLVTISTTNPNRFQTFFRYKRTGFVRVSDTTVEAGFSFGTLIANA